MTMMMIKVGEAYKRGSHIRPTASDKVTRSIFLTNTSKLMMMSMNMLTLMIMTMVMMTRTKGQYNGYRHHHGPLLELALG